MSKNDEVRESLDELASNLRPEPVRLQRILASARRRSRRKWLAFVAGAIALGVLVAVAAILLKTQVDPAFAPPVVGNLTPDLVGMSQAQATIALTDAGLALGPVSGSCRREPCVVAEQSPQPGARSRKGQRVSIGLVKAPRVSVRVPSVLGLIEPEARAVLAGTGLRAAATSCSGSVSCIVTSQQPGPGTRAPRGTGVSIALRVRVPRVLGLSEPEARALLHETGLSAIAATPCSGSGRCVVIRQSPGPDMPAPPGTVVSIDLASRGR